MISSDINVDPKFPIPVEILDLASEIMQERLKSKGICGSIPPSQIVKHIASKILLPNSRFVPQNSEGINIHCLNNNDNIHYVVSQKSFKNGNIKIKVYDSLPVGPKMWNLFKNGNSIQNSQFLDV